MFCIVPVDLRWMLIFGWWHPEGLPPCFCCVCVIRQQTSSVEVRPPLWTFCSLACFSPVCETSRHFSTARLRGKERKPSAICSRATFLYLCPSVNFCRVVGVFEVISWVFMVSFLRASHEYAAPPHFTPPTELTHSSGSSKSLLAKEQWGWALALLL